MRRTIANRLGESYRNAVHVTVSREVDAESLLATVEDADERFDADVSLVDGLLVALSATLDEHPEFNATFEEGVHTTYEEHNLGIAVAVEDGLLTPVLADAGELSLPELAAERRRLTELVQAGEHAMTDLRNGTFTVSNLGPLGVDSFTQVINPPEVAILGVGRLRERARPADGGDEGEGEGEVAAGGEGGGAAGGEGGVAFRRELTFDLSVDHRVVDGADAARFLATLAEHVTAAEELIED